MRIMGLEAIYPKPRTSRPHPDHKVYPYLLRDPKIQHPNQVWAADITYIPMRRGFMYLVAVMDWYSRKVLSWRLSNTLDSCFCIEALQEALQRYGQPDIFNTYQGAQFTSEAFTDVLNSIMFKSVWTAEAVPRITFSLSASGGRSSTSTFIWYSFENGTELRKGLLHWFAFYNQDGSTNLLTIKHRMRFTLNIVFHKLRLPESLYLK